MLGDERVARRAVRLANQRMRTEVLPLLTIRYPRPNAWNPLRLAFQESSPYGMKLWLQDRGALEVLRNSKLLDLTAQIALDATIEAAVSWEPKAFVTNILDAIMNDG